MKKPSFLIGSIVVVIIVIVGLIVSMYYILQKSLPEYDKKYSFASIQTNTKIFYDEFATPHIEASSYSDLFFAQGFAHARERLWQMELQRRVANGELSEVLGEDALGYDKFSRTVGIKRISQKIWEQSIKNDTTKMILESYAKGVNAFIALTKENKESLPIEFTVLQYEPKSWTPENSIAISRLMAWTLNLSWHIDVVMADIAAKLGTQKAIELFPTYPKNKPIIVDKEYATSISTVEKKQFTSKKKKKKTADVNQISDDALAAANNFFQKDQAFRNFINCGEASHFGSNSWVVTGKKSKTGKAILANDPHLQFLAPGQWMNNQLTCAPEKFNVSGEALPGTPLIVLGKNDSIAWGFTNMMLDDCDFFLIPNSPTDNKNFDIKEIEELIFVKGRTDPVIYPVKTFNKGVVISDENIFATKNVHSPSLQKNMVGMRWTGYEVSNELFAIFKINKASNWKEFLKGVKLFAAPGQNFLYGDVQGNIGYHSGALVPIRTKKNAYLFYNAQNDSDDWKGYIPFDELPQIYNPPSDMIVTANNKITTDSYPYYLPAFYEPPSRSERITELLQERSSFSADDMKAIQTDVISPHARDVMKIVLPILNKNMEAKKTTAYLYLENWQYSFDKKSIGALIYSVFYNELLLETLKDDLGPELTKGYFFSVNMPAKIMYELLYDTARVHWFDDIRTPIKETKEDIIIKSYFSALAAIENEFGKDPKNWFWENAHSLTIKHFFGLKSNTIGKIFNQDKIATGGTHTTINNGEHKFSDTTTTKILYPHILGASSRRIVDVANPNSFLAILPGGNSGHIWSSHYKDQLNLWAKGEYRTFNTNHQALNWKYTELQPKK